MNHNTTPRRAGASFNAERWAMAGMLVPIILATASLIVALACAVLLMLWAPPAQAQTPAPAPVEWDCGLKSTRADNAGTVLWAYCFGFQYDQVLVRKRVIMPSAITAEAKADAKQWVLTGTPDLWARATSEQVWNSPEAQGARVALEAALQAERAAGTIPKPRLWRVAPNPSSTTTPPTRPMWDPAGAKQVTERAYVGELCNCKAPVLKGTQVLCPLRQLGDLPPTANITACAREAK